MIDLHSCGKVDEGFRKNFTRSLSEASNNAIEKGFIKDGASVANHAAWHAVPYPEYSL
jgi:hypothetical protein